MRKATIVRLAAVVLLAGGLWLAHTQQGGPPASKLDLIKIKDDLYVIHNDYVPGNSTALITNDGVILVDGKAVPYKPEAQIVRQIFTLAEQRWGYTRLARWARENAPPKRTNDGADKTYSWNASTIKSILVSKTLRNLVVSEDQWQRTKAARQSDFRARAPKRWDWPLQGAVRCTCGITL